MVFPGDLIRMKINIGLSRDEIATFDKAIQKIQTDNKQQPTLVTFVPTGILIVIDYRIAEKDVHHQTGYVLNLYYHDPAQPEIPGLSLPIGVNIPAENLRLVQHIIGQYAD